MASFIGRKALNVAGRPSDRAAQRLGCMPSCSPLAPLTHHIRSLLAVFLLNFVFFPHGRRPYWRESLAFFPHKRSMGALGGQACLGWPRCFLYVASHSSRMGSCYRLGPTHMYNKLGLLREAPPPPPRMLAQQRSPNSRLSIVMSASSASPTLCAWVLSTCNQAHLAQWASSKLKLSPPNHRRMR